MAVDDQPEFQAIQDFLIGCQPFDRLPKDVLHELIGKLTIAYFRCGQVFDRRTPHQGLRILRSGAIEIRDQNNKLLDRLEEGESFNIASLSSEHSETRAILIEDALIYWLPDESYQQLRTQFRDFDRFFHTQRDRRLRRAVRYQETPHQMMAPIASLMSTDLLAVSSQETISSTAQLMTGRRVSSALIIDSDKLTGIVTDRDFRCSAVAESLPPVTPITAIMTASPITIDSEATVFDATLLMTRNGCHHLPVVDDGIVKGIVTVSDLMLAKQNDPVYLVQHLSRQDSIDALQDIVETIPNMLVEWSDTGVRASQISHVLTAISDAATARLIELALQEYGPPPVPFCWVGFGSQAREEQLIGADQDNGLIISDTLQDADRHYFFQLAKFVCDGLNRCGYRYCPGKIMATTEEWRKTLSGWKEHVDHWTRSPTPEAVMRVSIFFDLRSIYGDKALCRSLHRHMLQKTSRNNLFFVALADNVLTHTPPLGLFRRFLVESNGEHKDTLNLKKRGILPIIDMVRIHSLANNVNAVGTHARIAELVKRKALTITDGRNMQDAFDFIMQLRVDEQSRQIVHGEAVSNYINPDNLSTPNRRHLRDAFTVVSDSQEVLRINYRHGF